MKEGQRHRSGAGQSICALQITSSMAGRIEDDVWLDASGFLEAASNQLECGQLLHSQHFSLFEAMSAVEIGDPKMDAGLDAAASLTAEQLIQQGEAPVDLPPDQLLAVMDHLLALEASWHAGHNLAQTVFVCLYMIQPKR